MAKLFLSSGWATPDSLGARLQETLTDEYTVACEPVVQGIDLDAVLVGPQGLFVLHAKDWEGEILPAQRRAWRERLASGRVVSHPNPRSEAQRATRALNAFLRDEFPSLHPLIRHFVVFVKPGAKLAVYGATDPPCTTMDSLVKDIDAAVPQLKDGELGAEMCQRLAQALVDRQLTATQRAKQCFIFRSGGFLGIGKKAWTTRKVIKHMDRYPEDGVHHLRNATLERWFAEQGATHLAALAREVMSESEADPRVSLEKFLLATGLVRRPRLSARPRRINMGYTLTDETITRPLRLRKGRGRGYLFGTLRASESWIQVDPTSFGGSLDALVTVDTESLLITEQPSAASISVDSNASEEPTRIPLRVFVTAMPSGLNRYLLRPLAGLGLAGLLGAGVGWSIGHFGIQAPNWLTWAMAPPVSSETAWAALAGFLWGLFGLLRGFTQHPAWPTGYAIGRWLLKTLVWSAVLSSLVAGVLWLAQGSFGVAVLNISSTLRTSIILFAVAAGALPATVSEIRSARPKEEGGEEQPSARRTLRRALWPAIGIALVFIALAGARLAGPARERYDLDLRAATVQQWFGDRYTHWEASLRGFVRGLYVRHYDRRAPARPTPAPSPLTTPVAKEGD